MTRRLAIAALLASVSAPALASDFYNDTCRDDSADWTLSLSTAGDGKAQFWKDSAARVRRGTYRQQGDDVIAHLEDITLHLWVASGSASWTAGKDRGVMSCRWVSYDKLARWQDGPSAPTPFIPPAAVALAPEPPPYAPPPPTSSGVSDTVPLTMRGNAAYLMAVVGGERVEMLLDTGATEMTIHESLAERLVASGRAEIGPDGTMSLADGSTHPARHVIIHRLTVAGHTVTDVIAGIEPDGADMLLGVGVLRGMAGRAAVDFANSRLIFE
jgi:gag-polyprotein putative aspartyl protease